LEDKLEGVDLQQIVTEICGLYSKEIQEKNAIVQFNNLPTFQSFKAPIRQVFQNLIGNGLKYQNPGEIPFINIACEDAIEYWQFYVKDNGIGISAEDFDKIFNIFQRLHNKEKYNGTGMGLAVTKKIIENLGGKIWVESEEGKGSAFYFTIPK
jgi:light-regulated signal transduction histidine kinase (bacteriophytochrome)